MQKFKTQIRVKPLRSCDKTSTKYSLQKSILHNTRKYDENHIDNNKKNQNIFRKNIDEISFNCICERIEKLKKKYGLVSKNTTIDCSEFIFTVNKKFFDNPDDTDELNQLRKNAFITKTAQFLIKEFGDKDAVLSCIGHDDEDGFHVHAYAVPLHETEYKNRYGINKKIKINYRGKYANSQEEINKFRKENTTSTESKLGKLQTRWAEFISEQFPELERGEMNSKKRNISPKEYRKKIEKDLPILEENIKNLSKKNIELEQQNIKLEGEIKMKNENKNTIEKNIENLNMKHYQLINEITEMEKKKVEELRQIKPIHVAMLCGKKFFPESVKDKNGKTRKINNAIDYLVYVEKLSFAGSVKFLLDNYSDNSVIKLIKNETKEMKVNTETNLIKEDIIKKQFKALGNPIVRLTLQKTNPETGERIAYNIGKRKEQDEEIFYNVNQVIELIPLLNKSNVNGWNVYITPIEYAKKDTVPILIDDVKDLDKIEKNLGEPNLILETSKNNFQVVYLVENFIDYSSREKGKKSDRNLYNEIFKKINKTYGDETISGLRHPFRLAGFTNQKPNRNNTQFIKILHSNPNATNNIMELINEIKFKEEQNNFEKKNNSKPEEKSENFIPQATPKV